MRPLSYFEDRSIPEPNTGCWLWLGALGKPGYGNVKIDGKYLNAHVAAFEAAGGKREPGKVVRHTCDQRSCVNPAHLIPGTFAQNTADMFRRGRWPVSLSDADVDAIRAEPFRRGYRKALADRFGVSIVHIKKIRQGLSRTSRHQP